MEEKMHYLRSMEVMSQNVRIQFAAGNHAMQHKLCQLNGIWSDIAIEVTLVRFDHNKIEIIGITTKSKCGCTALLYAISYSKVSGISEISPK